MKKLILILTGMLLCMSCDPPQNAWIWAVKNSTDEVLKLKFPIIDGNEANYNTRIILPGDGIFLFTTHTNTGKRDRLNFDYYFDRYVSLHDEELSWQLLSEDDVVIKTWKYLNNDLPDQRFFNEASWHYNQGDGGYDFVEADYAWVFNILKEDISQQ